MTDNGDFFLEQYKDASANLRHYSNLRFAQLTIFIAATGALVVALFRGELSFDPLFQWLLAFMGGVLGIVFIILELRLYRYWEGIFDIAKELERELGFKQYCSRKRSPVISGHFAVLTLEAATILFWILVAIAPLFSPAKN